MSVAMLPTFAASTAPVQSDSSLYNLAAIEKHTWLHLGTGKNETPKRSTVVETQVCVIGAGMAGISAAVAAARQGVKVVLINDRPVLGGNASSEMRMTVNGAPFERETGIVEEILLDNRFHNPQDSYFVWDHVLYNYVIAEPNITLMLNTAAIHAIMEDDNKTIKAAFCWQQGQETEVIISADVFIDSSGDGLFAATAGAEYRTGREGKDEFKEKYAPDEPDGWVMGESIMMITKDMGTPTPFVAPDYAIKYDAEKATGRKINSNLREGFWWLELGSNTDIIGDRNERHHQLMAHFYGIWDYVKNSGKFPQAENLVIDWIGSLPGRRESRRFEGDYMLCEGDLINHVHFDDAVAYGGWSLDEHCPGGILALDQRPSYFHQHFKKYYEIPFRSLYSKNIDNLMFAGRNASVSHIALSSTRIIGTCCMMGQAVGVASAMCVEKNANPREIGTKNIDELQERMLREDYFIPNRPSVCDKDLARKANKIWATSTTSGDVKNLVNGVSRDVESTNTINHWQSEGLNEKVNLEWKKAVDMSSVEIKFDTNLKRHIQMYKDPEKKRVQVAGIPPELVKHFIVEVKDAKGNWKEVANVDNNIRRFMRVSFPEQKVSAVRISLKQTYGAPVVRLYEVRCY